MASLTDFGASICDAAACEAAADETVGRSFGNVVPEDRLLSSAATLQLSGPRVVDPSSLALTTKIHTDARISLRTLHVQPRRSLGPRSRHGRPDVDIRAGRPDTSGVRRGTRCGEPPIKHRCTTRNLPGGSRAEAETSAPLTLPERNATALSCRDRTQSSVEVFDSDRPPAPFERR